MKSLRAMIERVYRAAMRVLSSENRHASHGAHELGRSAKDTEEAPDEKTMPTDVGPDTEEDRQTNDVLKDGILTTQQLQRLRDAQRHIRRGLEKK